MGYRRFRWIIVALLFLTATINYVDRQTLSVLGPTLRGELHLTERDYANAVTAFLVPYMIMYTVSGRLIDYVGVRLGMAVCLTWWSIATMLTSLARGAFSLAFYRFLLGIGEPGVFPAGNKACGEWFPKRERALAAGIFSSGSAVGAVLAPPLVAWLTLAFGWRYAFLIPGMVGLFLLPLWLWTYRPAREHPWVSAQEVEFLRFEQDASPRRPWVELLRQRKVWALVLPRLASDPVWYFYVFWLPDYLQRGRHLSLSEIGYYGWIPFLFADLGNIGGGALSDWMIRRGIPAVRARMIMLILVGCFSPFGALVGLVDSAVVAVAFTCLVTFLCQCASTNMATLAIDLTPGPETASVIGLMGTAGSLGGVLFSQVLGIVIGSFGYPSAFILAAVLHPIAMLTLYTLLRPTLRQAAAPMVKRA